MRINFPETEEVNLEILKPLEGSKRSKHALRRQDTFSKKPQRPVDSGI